ncbi:MAG TPA: hypothetical protein VF661_02295 [Actinomycetales bacterium]|jgi:hypothetical protein
MIDDDIASRVASAYEKVVAPDALTQVLRRGNRLRRARRVRRAGTAAGAVTLTTVMAVSGLPSAGAPSAFASWTARPTVPTAEQARQIVEDCRAQLRESEAHGGWQRGVSGPGLDGSPGVLDVRGEYAIAIWDDGRGTSQCERWLDDEGRPRTEDGEPVGGVLTTSPVSDHRLPETPGGAVLSVEEVGGTGSRKDRGVVVQGWVGEGVTRVALTAPGLDVEASVDHGMFAAFWPQADLPSEDPSLYIDDVVRGTVTAYDATDRVLATVPFATLPHGPTGFAPFP